jgi:glycerate 2-kinase
LDWLVTLHGNYTRGGNGILAISTDYLLYLQYPCPHSTSHSFLMNEINQQNNGFRSAVQLRRDALRIWQSGVEAVLPRRLVPQWIRVEGRTLVVGQIGATDRPHPRPLSRERERGEIVLPLDDIRRIAVVGAGKAAAGMAAVVEEILGPELMDEKQLVGWVNVPDKPPSPPALLPQAGEGRMAAECPHPRPLSRKRARGDVLQRIHLHVARPAGVNEPTAEGVAGTMEILRLVESLGPEDLCLCLISGGGSALLPAPAEGISLADKIAVTRFLSAAGADIEQMNIVRRQLSRVKGGGLARACRAGRLVALILSDVLGDRLDLIASGPTVPDVSTPAEAVAVLEQFHAREHGISQSVFQYLNQKNSRRLLVSGHSDENINQDKHGGEVHNYLIGNNAVAVAAAAEEAERLGYAVAAAISAKRSEGPAEDVGRRLMAQTLELRKKNTGPTCIISGGEPVVELIDSTRRGLGGRNQQLALAALIALIESEEENIAGIELLSAGTDGEDGPTDAAGAFCDAEVLHAARRAGLDPRDYLARNDSYNFFAQTDALLQTGPTGTNVCDLRVALSRQ